MMPNPLRRLVPASLTRRLVITVVVLVALVSLLGAVVTTAGMRNYLNGQLDTEVAQSLERAKGAPHGEPQTTDGPKQDPGDHDGSVGPVGHGPDVSIPIGQGPGTLTAEFDPNGFRGDVVTTTSERQSMSAAALKAVNAVPTDGKVHVVRVPGLGTYRLMAGRTDEGRIVTGLPTSDIDGVLHSLVAWEVLLLIAGTGLAVLFGQLLVKRQLRPMREVAATAHDVSELPLSSGEIGTTARVPDRLTDPNTEVGQVGAALNRLLGHIEHALDARHRSEQQVRQFVADASHELRTPLSTIHGYAELSRRVTSADSQDLAQAMSKVEVEATRMSSLVDDLLLLARLDAGRPLERATVDLTKLVLEAVGDARVLDSDHRWALDLQETPVQVGGDEQRLHQVITNLLANGRRHTPAGTTVTVGVHIEEENARLTVHDDGPGITDPLIDKVFERFSRGDSSRTRASGGAGLGLSLVHAIVTAHGGTVSVRSKPRDTTFEIHLPIRWPAL